MSLQAFHANLKAQLAADPGLAAWAQTHFGRGFTQLDSNRPISLLRANESPLQIFELDDGSAEAFVGGDEQEVSTAMLVAVGWVETDYSQAFAQRLTLPELVMQAVLADPTLGGAVGGAWVSAWSPDKAANHPKHFMAFTISAEYDVMSV